MKTAIIILSVLSLGLAGTSYYLFDTNKSIQTDVETLEEARDDLIFKVKILEQEKTEIAQELEAKITDISQEKEEEIAKLKGTYDELVTDMKQEIEQGQIKITQLADRLSVSLVDKILFPSGNANITPEGIEVLERVGKVLKNTKDKIIRVEGHTDNIPIHSRLKEKYPTNWELSTARATNVVRFLQENIGIDSQRLHAVGMSEYHPVASNETKTGRSQNRRIEIALLPEGAKETPLDSK